MNAELFKPKFFVPRICARIRFFSSAEPATIKLTRYPLRPLIETSLSPSKLNPRTGWQRDLGFRIYCRGESPEGVSWSIAATCTNPLLKNDWQLGLSSSGMKPKGCHPVANEII